MSDTRLNVILDSGAYTAWRSGNPIDLDAYIGFAKGAAEWATQVICLDCINPSDPEKAAAQSMENYKRMLASGLKPIPVFHFGENIKWLKEMLDLGAEYIGLGAISGINEDRIDAWYEMIWNYLISSSGLPITKVHAFGEGVERMLVKYPWYSADSASWLYSAQRNASVTIGGKKLSHRADGLSTRSAPDIDGISGADKKAWEEMLKAQGVSQAAFTRDIAGVVMRTYLEAKHYIGIQNRISDACPIRHRISGFFCEPYAKERASVDIPDFRLHLVIGTNNIIRAICGLMPELKNVLISYAHLGKAPSTTMKKFRLDEFFSNPAKAALIEPSLIRYSDMIKEHINV